MKGFGEYLICALLILVPIYFLWALSVQPLIRRLGLSRHHSWLESRIERLIGSTYDDFGEYRSAEFRRKAGR